MRRPLFSVARGYVRHHIGVQIVDVELVMHRKGRARVGHLTRNVLRRYGTHIRGDILSADDLRHGNRYGQLGRIRVETARVQVLINEISVDRDERENFGGHAHVIKQDGRIELVQLTRGGAAVELHWRETSVRA